MNSHIKIKARIHSKILSASLIASSVLLFLCLSVNASDQPKPPQRIADVYIFAGQSNALGKKLSPAEYTKEFAGDGYLIDLPVKTSGAGIPPLVPEAANIAFSYHVGTVSHASAGGILNEVSSDAHNISVPLAPVRWKDGSFRFGPELSFAKKLYLAVQGNSLDEVHKVMIIKAAFGASGIQKHWLDAEKYRLLDKLKSRVEATIRKLKAEGFIVSVKALFWIQGEADIGRGNIHYFRNLNAVVGGVRDSVRKETGAEMFQTVIVRTAMVWNREANSCVVRCAQQQFVSEDLRGSLVNIDDLAKKDCFHYAADAYISIGERLYDAYVSRNAVLGDPYCDCRRGAYLGTPVIRPPYCFPSRH